MARDRDLEHQVVVALAPLIEFNIGVEVREGIVYLQGAVGSQSDRREAERLVSRVPGIKGVINRLIVDPTGYQADTHIDDVSQSVVDELEIEDIQVGEEPGVEPTFTGALGPTDVSATEDVVEFFPPTDPVEHDADREHQGMEIRGGWAPTSMTEPTEPDIEPKHFEHSDYEILEQVIHALRSDSATQDLDIKVSVHNSIVHLHGTVPSIEDAENAEDVASRVDGVLEVVEALEIEPPYIS